MQKPLGIILAGGKATRMGGGDKGRLEIGGQSLLERVMARLGSQVAGMAMNANGDAARFADLGLPVLGDSLPDHPGPLAGVLAGLDWAAEQGADRIVTAAADTPFFPTDLVARLEQEAVGMEAPLVLAASREGEKVWRQPTFGLWPVALREELRAALEGGLRKVVLWTDQHGGREAVFESAGYDPFFNINTPEDLATAQGLVQG